MIILFNQTNQIGFRHTACYNVSAGRTESTKELTEKEVDKIITELKKLQPAPQKKDFVKKPGDDQRKKLIGMAKQMNWGINLAKPWIYDTKLLMNELEKWCKKQKFKKGLMQHNVAELALLVTIFEQKVLPDYYKNLNR